MFLYLLLFIISVKYWDKKKNILNGYRRQWKKIKSIKLISQLLFLFRFFRHPIDSFYDLQRLGSASVLSATILYVFLFVAYLINRFQTGFIFSSNISGDANLLFEFAIIFIPLLAFIIVNYLVSTINDGEGSIKRYLYWNDLFTWAIFGVYPSDYIVIKYFKLQ